MNTIIDAAARASQETEADIFLYSGAMEAQGASRFVDIVRDKPAYRSNAVLILTTFGGDPNAAFRIMRALQNKYEVVSLVVAGPCKSAGTLIALGSNNLYIGDAGELGPLDIQMAKRDELFGSSSGLDLIQAVHFAQAMTWNSFEQFMLALVANSTGTISTKTAAEIASAVAVGLHVPIMSQIDPDRLGEMQRAMSIAQEYGQRLNRGNMKPGAIERLIRDYPSHGFVIDRREAMELFNRVSPLEGTVAELCRALRKFLASPSSPSLIEDLTARTDARIQESHDEFGEHANVPSEEDTVAHAGDVPEGSSGGDRADSEPNARATSQHAGEDEQRSKRATNRSGGAVISTR